MSGRPSLALRKDEKARVPAQRIRVVIVGAGFGRLHAALHFENLFSRNNGVEIAGDVGRKYSASARA